jgi:hypothetical protein
MVPVGSVERLGAPVGISEIDCWLVPQGLFLREPAQALYQA